MLLNQDQIKDIIPHREPFLLVDEIEEMTPGVSAVGYKNVTGEEGFFRGHFPEYPVMPGVLIIEALAQVGAISVLSLEENKGKLAFFGGIDKAKFRKQVVPGDRLKLEVEIIKCKGPMGVGHALATVDGQKAAEAEIRFMIADADK
ncbi:MAG: 3-hydroxyacyl-ACP dehydratase FabZ [Eubacterium sp.]|nr:3-hydroxyacyl-ACP dehydratase FabZ [Eubacterium sp.]